MSALEIILSMLCVALTITVVYLTTALIQRWKVNHRFTFQRNERPDLRVWQYKGAQPNGWRPGMRIIALRSHGRKPFTAKIGFKLGPNMTDYYGYVESNEYGEAVFSTYLGKNSTQFLFLVYGTTDIAVSSTELDQQIQPTAIYPPHPWQRPPFHFYG